MAIASFVENPLVSPVCRAGGDANSADLRRKSHSHGHELFLNHVWESLNAAVKILFFAVATPVMLAAWGAEQFGLFAIANSCVALVAILDLGLRTITRVGLTNPALSETEKVRLHTSNFVAFTVSAGATLIVVVMLAAVGCWHRWLNLPPAGDFIIAITCALTIATMALQLLLEPIAAAGQLSKIKMVLFTGNLLAFVAAIVFLKTGATVSSVVTAYFAALGLPLLFLLPRADLQWSNFLRTASHLRLRDILNAIASGGWINLITGSYIFQSYGLVLLIASVLGPAAAGTFFLFLKLAELLGVLGASASEPTIAAIAGARASRDRQRLFATSYKSALALCLAGAVVYSFFCGELFRWWLHRSLDHSYTGFFIGLFGVANGFNRMTNAACLGLAKPRAPALGLFFGAIMLAGSVLFFKVSNETLLLVGCGVILFMLPCANLIARKLSSSLFEVWLKPIFQFAPTLALIIAICWLAARPGNVVGAVIAMIVGAILCAPYIFRDSLPQPKGSVFGYDTRSARSALVMRTVDLFNPFRRKEPFYWNQPCVVASTAGLGDLFIHLPLIAGIVDESNRRRIDISVALRPDHTVIGQACGWKTLPFDNALEDVFKNPKALRVSKLFRTVRTMRSRKTNLWIDLTGSAVSALAAKLGGARKIAARITRGGRSLINHHLPHSLHENEYANLKRVATQLGCQPQPMIFERLRGEPLPNLQDAVVLCLTTACEWKTWPAQNFLALIDRFPNVQFVVTGFADEVPEKDHVAFAEILRRPNVISQIDRMPILDLVRLIAHARAVVTSDTSTAHIANAFCKPGAALFGPTSPDKWAPADGLKPFVDRTCPFHPCVQWTCAQPSEWCMRKIDVEDVASHLSAVLATTFGDQAATANHFLEASVIGNNNSIH